MFATDTGLFMTLTLFGISYSAQVIPKAGKQCQLVLDCIGSRSVNQCHSCMNL